MSFLSHWHEDWAEFKQEEQVALWTTYVAVAGLIWFYAPTAINISLGGAAFLLFRRWMIGARCRCDVSLKGKTVLVTGGNCGIGREVALDLSRRGARVLVASRDVTKSRLAAAQIHSETGGEVVVKTLDLSSFQSVKELAADICATEPHLHILVNNAGVFMVEESQTANGHDTTLQVNYLGHWLLTQLLTEKLKASAPARIVNVSSVGHLFAKLNIDDLDGRRVPWSPWSRYGASKLLQILHARELTRRLRPDGITAFSAHPGFVDTDIFRDRHFWWYSMKEFIFSFIGRNARRGAQTVVYCAVEPSLLAHPSALYADCAPGWISSQAMDDMLAAQAWEATEKLLNI